MMHSHNEEGFTLVEWLVGLSIGVSLLMCTCQLYLNAYQFTNTILGSYEMRSNEGIALGFLAHDIRMAGFISCPNLKEVTLAESPYQLTHALMTNQDNTLILIQKRLSKLKKHSTIPKQFKFFFK